MNSSKDFRPKILYAMAFNASLGSVVWGYNISVFNALRAFLQSNVFPGSSDFVISLLASSLTIGAAGGSFFAGKLLNAYGRLNVLIVSDLVGILAIMLTLIQSLPIMILGKTIIGIIIGINGVAVSLYNVEMSPISIKGIMSSISMSLLSFGVTLGLSVQLVVPDPSEAEGSQIWRILFALPLLFHLSRLSVLKYFLNYETPLYLAMQDKIDGVRDVLKVIYTDNIERHLQRVLHDKNKMVSKSGGSITLADMFSPRYKKAFYISLFIMAGVQMSGFTPVFVFFNVYISDSANNNSNEMALFATIMGIISFLSAILANIIVDKLGRKVLFVVGMAFMTVIEFLYIFIVYFDGTDNSSLKYILSLWPLPFRISTGTLAFIYVPELLPSVGVAMASFLNWGLAFVNVQSCLAIVHSIGTEGSLMIHGVFCLVSTIIYQKYIIESKGRTKAELLDMYNNIVPKPSFDESAMEMAKIPLIKKSIK